VEGGPMARSTTLAAVALLLALGPGPARAERADRAPAALPFVADEAPVCREDPIGRMAGDVQAVRRRVMAELAARADAPGEEVVVLNNRGYNYGPGEQIDPVL